MELFRFGIQKENSSFLSIPTQSPYLLLCSAPQTQESYQIISLTKEANLLVRDDILKLNIRKDFEYENVKLSVLELSFEKQEKDYVVILFDVRPNYDIESVQRTLKESITPYSIALVKGERASLPHFILCGHKEDSICDELIYETFGKIVKASPKTGELQKRKLSLPCHYLGKTSFLFSTISSLENKVDYDSYLEISIIREEYLSKTPKNNLNTLSDYFTFYNALVFDDDFDGVRARREFVFENQSFIRNQELQEYAKSYDDGNIHLQNGILSILSKKEEKNGQSYSSASLTTAGTAMFQYGRFEIRAKLPKYYGSWPAFWMMGQVTKMTGISEICSRWPESGEIDIMEYISEKEDNKIVHQTLHIAKGPYMNGLESSHSFYELENGTFADDFHTFGLVWDERRMIWYVDDKIVKDLDITDSKYDALRRYHYYMILNLAVGGSWPGSPKDTYLSDSFDIDYVRVYQKK